MAAGYDAREHLASLASRQPGARDGLPALFLFTDPDRTPDPVAAVRGLPPGCGVVWRHFGAPGREETGRALRRECDTGGHVLLVAADPELAARIGADGVHWPGWARPGMRASSMQHFALTSASAHSGLEAARAARAGADLIFLSPVFASASPSAGRPLGPLRGSAIARETAAPVYALGGVDPRTARKLTGLPFAGLACVSALVD